MVDAFWEQPDVVQRFAEREVDHRVRALVEDYPDPGSTRVLDVGCAGGRNTVFLAQRGFDVRAVDASEPMVRETRRRLAAILGAAEATQRVQAGRMDDLGAFDDAGFDLVISLGVLHNARDWAEWQGAAAESARVLKPGGRLLLNQFTPATNLTGSGVQPVTGQTHVYEGLPAGRGVLLDAETLDAELASFGLEPELASETVTGQAEHGQRVSVNALYRKRTDA